MWQKFTQRARRVILLGQEEAGKRGNLDVCTHHLLLGILRDESCVAAHLLTRMQIPLPNVRTQLESAMQHLPRPIVVAPKKPSLIGQLFGAKTRPAPTVAAAALAEPKLTPLAKRVLELAVDEARRLQHDYIGTEHLLLALIRQDTATAALVLFKSGVTLEKARAGLIEYLGTDEAKAVKSVPVAMVPGAGQWTHFTERARHAIVLAQSEAKAMNYDYVGTAHLLLGLLLENESVAAQILQRSGITTERVRAEITPQASSEISTKEASLTPRAKMVLQLASEESKRMKHNYIGTEHLLLGIARMPDTLAAQVLKNLGQVRKDVYTTSIQYIAPELITEEKN